MGILLLDCSSKKTEFGYCNDKGDLIINRADESGNAENLPYNLKIFFEEKEIKREEIETVSISNGPGSFTGLRIGSAIAKGICFSLGCKLVEIVTLDLIANKSSAEKEIIPLIFSNSRSLEFYFCRYEKKINGLKRISEYGIAGLDEILQDSGAEYLINEPLNDLLPEPKLKYIKEVSDISNIESLLELTNKKISEKIFSDYRTSVPFYMKDFIPKN